MAEALISKDMDLQEASIEIKTSITLVGLYMRT